MDRNPKMSDKLKTAPFIPVIGMQNRIEGTSDQLKMASPRAATESSPYPSSSPRRFDQIRQDTQHPRAQEDIARIVSSGEGLRGSSHPGRVSSSPRGDMMAAQGNMTTFSPNSGRPTKNPMISALLYNDTVRLHTNKRRHASLVRIHRELPYQRSSSPSRSTHPLKQSQTYPSTPPLVTGQTDHQTPISGPAKKAPQKPLPHGVFSSSPLRIEASPDAFVQAPKPKSNTNRTQTWNQLVEARRLRGLGIEGPFPIGSYLCRVDPHTGAVEKVAARKTKKDGTKIWVNPKTKKEITRTVPQSGKAVWAASGAFLGFAEVSVNAWLYSACWVKQPEQAECVFKPTGCDVFMGAPEASFEDELLG